MSKFPFMITPGNHDVKSDNSKLLLNSTFIMPKYKEYGI